MEPIAIEAGEGKALECFMEGGSLKCTGIPGMEDRYVKYAMFSTGNTVFTFDNELSFKLKSKPGLRGDCAIVETDTPDGEETKRSLMCSVFKEGKRKIGQPELDITGGLGCTYADERDYGINKISCWTGEDDADQSEPREVVDEVIFDDGKVLARAAVESLAVKSKSDALECSLTEHGFSCTI